MPLNRTLTTTFFLAAIMFAESHARAQDLGALAGVLFNRMDTNHDGLVTKDEARASRARLFDQLDADHDGFLTSAEAEAARDASRRARLARIAELRAHMVPPPERMAELDQNGDSKVSRDEFMAGGTPVFDRFDHTGHGLSRADFAAVVNGAQ